MNLLVIKGCITLPTFHLDLVNLIRIKQLTAVMQVFQVFAGLSTLLAVWFLNLANLMSHFSMPFEINPVCVPAFQTFSNSSWHFTSALITIFTVALLVYFLLNAHKVECLKSRLSFSAFEKMQAFAALIVIQAPLIVLPTTINAEAMAEDTRSMYYYYAGVTLISRSKLADFRFVLNLLIVILVAVALTKITHGVTKKFNLLRKEVLVELEDNNTVDDVIAQAGSKQEDFSTRLFALSMSQAVFFRRRTW